MAERLAKFMARSGVCSRRDAEELIKQKRVTVNGDIIDTPATMAVKSHLRNNLPVIIAPSTNNGLSRKCS